MGRLQEQRSEPNRLTPRCRARPLRLPLRQTNGRAPHMNPGARPPSRMPKRQPRQVNTHGSTTRPLGAHNGSLSESASRRALQHRRGHTGRKARSLRILIANAPNSLFRDQSAGIPVRTLLPRRLRPSPKRYRLDVSGTRARPQKTDKYFSWRFFGFFFFWAP